MRMIDKKPILCKSAISLLKPTPLKSVDDQPILYLRKYTDKQLQHILQKWLTINLNPFKNAKKIGQKSKNPNFDFSEKLNIFL